MDRLPALLDRPEPTMAVPVTREMTSEEIMDIAAIADVAEFRADRFPIVNSGYSFNQARRLASIPLVATVRLETEGGSWDGSEADRLALFEELLPTVDGVDVELAADILPDVVAAAHEAGKTVIVSSHDFKTVPPISKLDKNYDQAMEAGADYFKVAGMANTLQEFRRLQFFTIDHQADKAIIVAMGAYGVISRLAFPLTGSRLTYAAADQADLGLGQMTYQQTHQCLKNISPAYAKLFN